MEYDIIEQVSELAVSEGSVEEKLGRAAGMLAGYLHFDQCVVYLIGDDGGFEPVAAGPIDTTAGYRRGEGLPRLAVKEGAPVEVHKEAPGKVWEGVEDWGLEGFRTALVYPLREKERSYGVLYLKARKRVRLTLPKRQALKLSAMQFLFLVKSSELLRDHHRVYAELVDMQQKLVNSEKLLALGDMAATMAHEIRNPLLSIGGYAARLRRQLPPGSPGICYIEQMSAEIGRIEKIMNGIIRFLKDNVVELKPDDLNEIVDDALELFSDELSAHAIRVDRRSSGQALPVLADREQMKIAFDNIIANAIQSMEKGGTISVVTSLAGEFSVAKVSDTGGGIDPKSMGYIFNPFFTTKKHGTGLGLPIANSIIMRHKGVIEVLNEGPGAVFTIKLPLPGAMKETEVAAEKGQAL
ncbi:MAG TPA: hypothetical protein DDW94_12050 [Deltaproteobacteria bacterium]|nr:MAG: hypothetical protein A2Z79_08195 [Deltaproteobacteria bacterium GWA2_55_82]OGQ63105.1 MAG: hypothetical protein A3I81_09825 [Deltaproteobacteria bacterium RIFCSPLOWO2_02_FULL_55_12]OIJ73567.1 MAG: hypothetical protein A2V21_304390 [Deltaproteobacteria bacterium GWC2_55_46]HBG47700.1 hypothetical protein [Deltaproteobacteria bacterium]HCY12078.1 hypothetical protein [Deltaproteobacteria bacterium]